MGFFAAFFGVLILLALSANNAENAREDSTSTSTPRERSARNTSEERSSRDNTSSSRESRNDTSAYEAPPKPPPPPLTPSQVEAKVASLYKKLDALKEDIRTLTLSSPESPYKNTVKLSRGNVSDEDPDREYLLLSVNGRATSSVNISNWYVRSYVTDEVALIPNGDRILARWRNPEENPIVLGPGEKAYLITGKSPINGSFKENMCSGYLREHEDFYPSLSSSCPNPRQEFERYGSHIKLDNDKCYAYIESLKSCTEPDEETYTRSKVGNACRAFIEDTFSYPNCIRLHRYDPYFSRVNDSWHIYLDERTDLWRPKREIIQLMDEYDRVVAVIEY
jgi:hypothetical protein